MIRTFSDHIWNAKFYLLWPVNNVNLLVWDSSFSTPKIQSQKQNNSTKQNKAKYDRSNMEILVIITIQWNYEIKSRLCNVSGSTIFTPNKQMDTNFDIIVIWMHFNRKQNGTKLNSIFYKVSNTIKLSKSITNRVANKWIDFKFSR